MDHPAPQTPVERLRIALELFGLGESVMRQNLRREFPSASPAEIEEKLTQWLRNHPLLWSAELLTDPRGPSRRQS